jgi:hypothetical protein
MSLFEAVLPPELLKLPDELVRVDELPDDPVFFVPTPQPNHVDHPHCLLSHRAERGHCVSIVVLEETSNPTFVPLELTGDPESATISSRSAMPPAASPVRRAGRWARL